MHARGYGKSVGLVSENEFFYSESEFISQCTLPLVQYTRSTHKSFPVFLRDDLTE